jgi:hypothetical protein
MAAGDLYVLVTIAVIFPIVISFAFLWGGISANSIPFFLGVPELILLLCVCLGHSERRRDAHLQEELRKSGHI